MESAEEPMTEEEILARYSTPGLRKHELNRVAKKDHLAGQKVTGADAKKILDQMYGEEPCPTNTDSSVSSESSTSLPSPTSTSS